MPSGVTPLTVASPEIFVSPSRSRATCQIGAVVARGTGETQERYAIVGTDCASAIGTTVENTDTRARLGKVATTVAASDHSWTVVLVRLEPGVGWWSAGKAKQVAVGDEVAIIGLGDTTYRVGDQQTSGRLRLDGFTVPFGRTGASVVTPDGTLVAIATGPGPTAVTIGGITTAASAIPGFDGLALL